ncbi:hypothetical protein J6590_074832 [Homalodisca vitripennis]|nr:hypothetical protein J6590_074832 [Homalodisca vitripennis]
MIEDVGWMKYIFALQSFFGLSTVSLVNLKQCKWRVTNSYFWIAIYSFDFVDFFVNLYKNSESKRYPEIVGRILNYGFAVHMLIQNLLDHKTQVAAVLNLRAVEDQLRSYKIKKVPIQKCYLLATLLSAFLHLCHAIIIVQSLWNYTTTMSSVIKFATVVHIRGMFFSIFFSFVIMTTNRFQIKSSLDRCTEGLTGSIHREITKYDSLEPHASYGIHCFGNLHKMLKASLDQTKADSDSYFSVFIAWFFLNVALSVPHLIHSLLMAYKNDFASYIVLVTLLVKHSIVCFTLIHVSEVCVAENAEEVVTLSRYYFKSKTTRVQTNVKHRVLANIHRSVPSFSLIFTTEYFLFLHVWNTGFMVFTSVAGSRSLITVKAGSSLSSQFSPSTRSVYSSLVEREVSTVVAMLTMVDWLLLAVGLLAACYWYLSWNMGYWRARGVYTLPGALPGVGHMLDALLLRRGVQTICIQAYK